MKKFKRIISGILVLMLCLTLMPTIPISAAGVGVDLIGDSVPSSVGTIKRGVSYVRTGYLCYLLTADGNAVSGTQAYAFKCPGFAEINLTFGNVFRATSRKGGYSASSWKGTAPWGCSPFNSDQTTNSEIIRAWMKSNGASFVEQVWGTSCADKFVVGDYILIIETIMHFQYTFDYTYDKSWTQSDWRNLVEDEMQGAPSSEVDRCAEYYYEYAQEGKKYRAPFGQPIIGTIRDCLSYYNVMKAKAESDNPFIDILDVNLFSPYLNKVACYAERIGSGSAGERAGFVAYTGDITVKLSDSQVYQYGVGMLAISALEDDIVPPPPGGPAPSSYDGTVYTLTSSGGSSSTGGGANGGQFSGGGAGSTTHLGNGYNDGLCHFFCVHKPIVNECPTRLHMGFILRVFWCVIYTSR